MFVKNQRHELSGDTQFERRGKRGAEGAESICRLRADSSVYPCRPWQKDRLRRVQRQAILIFVALLLVSLPVPAWAMVSFEMWP
jgi:hypothetical protein